MDHDRKMGLVNDEREQKNKKKEETERKRMQDEDLSIEWRWVAETSSEEDAEKIEEEWEREQMKDHDSRNSMTGSRPEASEDQMKMTQHNARPQRLMLGREARILQGDGECLKLWFRC